METENNATESSQANSRIAQFKAERSMFGAHVSLPIANTRSKFEADDRKIKGYPIVWGERNDFNEIHLKGSTLNSLNARGLNATKNPIMVLNQHNQNQVLARPSVLQEDDYGLYFEADIIKGTQYADEVVAQIRQGVIGQLSVGFNYIWDNNKIEYDADTKAYILKEIKLYEISVVTFSSNGSTQLRSYGDFQLRSILNQYTPQDLQNFQALISLSGAATSTPHAAGATSTGREEKEVAVDESNSFINNLKLF
jgi:HK97 family phage prohead protease